MISSAAVPTLSQSPIPAVATAGKSSLSRRRVAFTTPQIYSERLVRLLHLRAAIPVPIPTIAVEPTPRTIAALRPFLSPESMNLFSSLLLISRTSIASVAQALALADSPPPLAESGDPFVVAALGRDADLLTELDLLRKLCRNPNRIRVLTPKIALPSALVEEIGKGGGRRALCPVPEVIGLEEPSVVPDFLKEVEARGWVPVRVPAYETRLAEMGCVGDLVGGECGCLDAIVFTSSAEVEGLLKGLEMLGCSWKAVKDRWPEMVVAAHGPVTAKGAERLGVVVDVVSSSFNSFDGVLDALESVMLMPRTSS